MKGALRAGVWLGALAGLVAGDTSLTLGCTAAGVMMWPYGRKGLGALGVGAWKLGVRAWWASRLARVKISTNHGSARWLEPKEAAAASLFSGAGLIMGRMAGRVLRHPSREANMVVFAPQGAGKGVGIVIPNLLTHRGSVICIDPKGENFAITAEQRLVRGPVWLMSMSGQGPSHCFNPMDTVEIGSGEEDGQAARLAELLMPHEVTSEAHWRVKSVGWLTGLILHVAQRFEAEPDHRHLGQVHEYLTLPPSLFVKLIAAMQRSPLQVVRQTAAEMIRSCGTGEGPSILSSMAKGTTLFSMGRTSGVRSSRSDFRLVDLFGAQPASLYLQVPLGDMAVYAPWLRVMIGLANHASMAVATVPDERPLFVLDEAATLGEIKEIQDTIGQGRAYHQKMFIYQDMAQLKRANPGWASVLANCQIHIAFAVNDLDTAEMLSKRLGDQTIVTRSYGVSSGTDAVLSHHQNVGQGEHGRRLLQPNEVLHLPEDKAVVSVQGLGLPAPMLADRIAYYREAEFAGRFGTWCGSGLAPAHAAVFGDAAASPAAGSVGYSAQQRLVHVQPARPMLLAYDPAVAPGGA